MHVKKWFRNSIMGRHSGDEGLVEHQENEMLRRAVAELATLNELARAIGGSQDSEYIIHSIVSRAREAVLAEQATLHVIDSGSEAAWQTRFRTKGGQTRNGQLHLNAMLEGWMLRHKRPLRCNDPDQNPILVDAVLPQPARNLLAVPLISHSRVTGILMAFNTADPDGFDHEDERLLVIIAAQSAQVLENSRLAAEEKALRAMQEQLKLAREIQISLLPGSMPAVSGYELAGNMMPAQEVGGDYYDFIPLGDGRLVLCVGDVSGKGVPAAMLMANLQATLRTHAALDPSVETCLAQTNALLYDRTPIEKFVTLFYGVFDPDTHRLSFGNAGHEHPLLLRAATGKVERLDRGGMVAGAFPGIRYEEHRVDLAVGDVLLVYSDGVTDAENLEEEPFGEEILCALLAAEGARTATEIVTAIGAAVTAFVGQAPQIDDITLLVLRRNA